MIEANGDKEAIDPTTAQLGLMAAKGRLLSNSDLNGFQVVSVDETSLPAWETYITSQSAYGSMHHSAWFQILSRCSAVQPIFLAALDQDTHIRGVMPCYSSNSIFSGRHIATLRGGILAETSDIAAGLHAAALAYLNNGCAAGYLLERGGMQPLAKPVAQIDVVHTFVNPCHAADALFGRLKKRSAGRYGRP